MAKLLGLVFFLVFAQFSIAHSAEITGRAEIVDGDTLDITGTRIRLYGIDAPEAGQKCNRQQAGKWRCGVEAIKAISNLTAGKTVVCVGEERDDYDRLISICKVGDLEINKELVRLGYAWNYDEYTMAYKKIEAESRERKLGVFQSVTQTPWTYRKQRWEVKEQIAPNGCPIKGNISNGGKTWIYHTPWSRDYDDTKVSPEKGERWFCSEKEALDAGWRAPKGK